MTPVLRNAVSCLAWPVLLGLCVTITAYGFSVGSPVIGFNVAYIVLAVILLILEKYMPHEREWQAADGQTLANIGHTLVSKGTVQSLIVFGGVVGITQYITPVAEPGYGLWPRQWPMAAQVILAVYISEFMLYWGHRLAHEWMPLWRFHAVHHSVTRLWIVNTGRFHFIDSLKSIVLGMAVLLVLGAPLEVVSWLSAITAFIGMLTHCNVDMRFGPLSWIFNTPELHRWHHSRDLREGNKNYGENVMLWDILLGTYFREPRRPPVNIGINEYMPDAFAEQLMWPFMTKAARKRRKARTMLQAAGE